jgi:hypothetical protein
MKVTRLEVKRQESYEPDAGQFKGIVTLTGSSGQQTVVLSNQGLARIFGVIAQEVTDTARKAAAEVKRGMEDAMNEPLLLDATEVKELPNA